MKLEQLVEGQFDKINFADNRDKLSYLRRLLTATKVRWEIADKRKLALQWRTPGQSSYYYNSTGDTSTHVSVQFQVGKKTVCVGIRRTDLDIKDQIIAAVKKSESLLAAMVTVRKEITATKNALAHEEFTRQHGAHDFDSTLQNIAKNIGRVIYIKNKGGKLSKFEVINPAYNKSEITWVGNPWNYPHWTPVAKAEFVRLQHLIMKAGTRYPHGFEIALAGEKSQYGTHIVLATRDLRVVWEVRDKRVWIGIHKSRLITLLQYPRDVASNIERYVGI